MKLILLACVFVALTIENAHCGMTEAQFKNAAKMLRNVCQPKTKISNAAIDGMHSGTFTGSQEEMCYTECIFRTGQIMKDAKLNEAFLRTQLSNLPDSISAPGYITTENCIGSIKSTEKCAAAYEFYKCFYEDNPANFFLP